jgi:hypothetical protein
MCVIKPLLASRRGGEAAAEFQKILDHRGVVVSDPVGALAGLQFARALVVSSLHFGETPTPIFRSPGKLRPNLRG